MRLPLPTHFDRLLLKGLRNFAETPFADAVLAPILIGLKSDQVMLRS
jgi:hypothetical protein